MWVLYQSASAMEAPKVREQDNIGIFQARMERWILTHQENTMTGPADSIGAPEK